MSSRYDELERLQRLRDSGALSDEEFQAEKARLLGHGPTAEVEPDADSPRSRLWLYAAIAAAAVALAVAAGFLLGRFGSPDEAPAPANQPAAEPTATENLIEAQVPDVRTLPPQEQLARAFEAAFGRPGSAILQRDSGSDYGTESFPERIRYTPGRLIWPSFGPVLISEGEVEDAAHVSAGKIGVHYLRPSGERFDVAGAFPAAVVTGSFGKLGQWSLSDRFSNWPVIVAEGGGTWQGYSCSSLTLTELRPGGPVELVTLPLSYSDAGAQADEDSVVEIEGRLANAVRGRSFEMRYAGTETFTETYVRRGNGYVLAGGGETRMRTC